MLKKFASMALLALLVACDSGSVTSPTPQPNTPVAQQEVPPPVAPQPLAPPAEGPSFEGRILPFAGWDVKNTSGTVSQMTAYYTSFDNQSLSLGSKVYTVQTGDSFTDTFNKTCVQVDITYGDAGDAPFLAGFIDDQGAVVKQITVAIRAACAPKEEPKCEETQEPNVTYGEYSWLTPILEGKCEREVSPIVVEDTYTPQLNCHQTGSQSYTTDLLCSEDTQGTRSLCRNVACPTTPPCVNVPTTRTVESAWVETAWSDWSACTNNVSTRTKDKTRTVTTYSINSCTQAETITSVVTEHYRDYPKTETKPCGICYYTISGEPQGADRQALCQQAAGVTYINWNVSPNHCATTLPGLYKDTTAGNNWNLVPGQSDDACRKGDAPKPPKH
jgi:hypothetical protein